MEIWLIRHGTTKANLEGRLQGQQEFPLDDQGIYEVAQLAEHLKKTPLHAILSSPLSRAKETAKAIQQVREKEQVEFLVLNLLKEYSWGYLEGFTWEELRQTHPEFYQRLKHDFWGTSVPGREGKKVFINRIKKTLRYILSRYRYSQRIVVVSHGRFINAFITHALELDMYARWPFSPLPAAISVLKVSPSKERLKLHSFNDRCYLQRKS